MTNLNALGAAEQATLAALLQKISVVPEGKPEKKPHKRRTQIKYFTEPEVNALFRAIDSTRDHAIFRIAYHRGLRASEVGALDFADWDARDERLNVKRKKGSKSGEYHVTLPEVRALRAWVKERGTEPGPLFPSRQGKGISQQMLDILIKRYGRKAGLPAEKCHMHSLKHSIATHLINRGMGIDDVQDHIGHRNIENTKIYTDFGDKRRFERDKRLRDW